MVTWESRLVETHISTLFFVGDRVYKMKKPVSMGFLDFTTRMAREQACHREVELNRRLAPDVYLGVADVSVGGEPCDHLVVMRRLPDDRRLSSLVGGGADVDAELRSVAHLLASFHARSERSETISQAGSPEAVLSHWEENFVQMQPFVGEVLDPAVAARVEELVRRYLAGRGPLLRRRMADAKVCDGHGDRDAAYGQGLYRAEATTATYAEMLLQAGTLLELGESVILDASWTRAPFRQQAGDLARATASRLIQLRCTLDPIIASQRIARRREAGGDPSDADAAIAAQMAAQSDPWPEAVAIDTVAHIGAVIGAARAQLDDNSDGNAPAEVGH